MALRSRKRGIDGPASAASVRAWLVEEVGRRVECAPEEVDTTKTFEEYGLDSRASIQLTGDLEKVVNLRLSPALLYEYQTIDAVSRFVALETEQA